MNHSNEAFLSIVRIALSNVNAENLVDAIALLPTEQQAVFTAVALGTYKAPELFQSVVSTRDDKAVFNLTSFGALNSEVSYEYSYENQENLYYYFNKNQTSYDDARKAMRELYTGKSYDEAKKIQMTKDMVMEAACGVTTDIQYVYMGLPNGKFRTSNDSMSLDKWMGLEEYIAPVIEESPLSEEALNVIKDSIQLP